MAVDPSDGAVRVVYAYGGAPPRWLSFVCGWGISMCVRKRERDKGNKEGVGCMSGVVCVCERERVCVCEFAFGVALM
jgi:hypothetical protein